MANTGGKLLTYLVGISHVQDIGRMNILVQCFLNQILRFISSQLGNPVEGHEIGEAIQLRGKGVKQRYIVVVNETKANRFI